MGLVCEGGIPGHPCLPHINLLHFEWRSGHQTRLVLSYPAQYIFDVCGQTSINAHQQ